MISILSDLLLESLFASTFVWVQDDLRVSGDHSPTPKQNQNLLAPSHLTGGLLPDLLVDLRLDPLVLFRGDTLPHLPVGRISAQDEGVKDSHARENAARDVPQKALVAPSHGGHEDVK
mmetsp:Transcript_12174/g.28670  ORF Transcript_12174/g.28670 Transcript_12174/m.28670 type:complete len:118 (+) Transcript_12174:563-916(+)